MRSRVGQFAALTVCSLVGCGSPEPTGSVTDAGGSSSTGGADSGGASASTGGVDTGVGGAAELGGAVGSGGAVGFGGSGTGGSGVGGAPGSGGTGTGGSGVGGAPGSGGAGTGGDPATGGTGGGESTCVPGVDTGDACNPAIDTQLCERSDRTCVCGTDSLWTCTPIGQGGTGGTGGGGTGGEPASGGTGTGGDDGTGGEGMGGEGTGGASSPGVGPCDIYADAGTPCVAAYSMIRSLSSSYTGPLYQVRSGSNAQNTGTGGTLHDIPQTADGFGDAAAQDAVCGGTICTVSILYDQSGMGNDLIVATAGNSAGGEYADDDDFETIADAGPLTVGGHNVYSLYMEARQGYRTPVGVEPVNGMPVGTEHQGTYELADGTHYGTACCWDFGNVTSTPAVGWDFMDTLFFGVAYWGRGEGSGPWFMADFEAGVWAGGSNPGEDGWGALDSDAPPNSNNPSLRVPFAIGFLKVSSDYSLRMADLETANSLTTAYQGAMPKAVDHQGAVVLGVGGDNSNNSWGTFFEGAIVAGYPSDAAEDAVMQNVKDAGYGQ